MFDAFPGVAKTAGNFDILGASGADIKLSSAVGEAPSACAGDVAEAEAARRPPMPSLAWSAVRSFAAAPGLTTSCAARLLSRPSGDNGAPVAVRATIGASDVALPAPAGTGGRRGVSCALAMRRGLLPELLAM